MLQESDCFSKPKKFPIRSLELFWKLCRGTQLGYFGLDCMYFLDAYAIVIHQTHFIEHKTAFWVVLVVTMYHMGRIYKPANY